MLTRKPAKALMRGGIRVLIYGMMKKEVRKPFVSLVSHAAVRGRN